MTRPRPPSSQRYAHHRDRAPDCPNCETNLFVAADRGRDRDRRCHHCGWTTTFDDAGDGDGSRAHGIAREGPPDNPHGGCPTDTAVAGESEDVGRIARVIRDDRASYASGGESE